MTPRKFLPSALALLIGLSAAFASAAPAAAEELRIAAQPMPLYAPLFVAKEKKWVDEELAKDSPGAAARWSSFPAGPPINESFAAGQQDVGFLGDTPALIGKAAGLDTSIIAITSEGPTSLAVVVGNGSPITSPRDLKGKKVAVTKGSYAHHLLALVLAKGGLSLNDIEQINLPNGDIPPAIIAGTIDAGAVWEPVLTRFESQKAIRVLADGTGLKKGLLVVVAGADVLKNRPGQVKALLRAYKRGADFIRSDPKAAAELIAADVSLSPDLLQSVLAKITYAPPLSGEDVAEIKQTEAFMREHALLKAPVDVDAFINRKISAEAGW